METRQSLVRRERERERERERAILVGCEDLELVHLYVVGAGALAAAARRDSPPEDSQRGADARAASGNTFAESLLCTVLIVGCSPIDLQIVALTRLIICRVITTRH